MRTKRDSDVALTVGRSAVAKHSSNSLDRYATKCPSSFAACVQLRGLPRQLVLGPTSEYLQSPAEIRRAPRSRKETVRLRNDVDRANITVRHPRSTPCGRKSVKARMAKAKRDEPGVREAWIQQRLGERKYRQLRMHLSGALRLLGELAAEPDAPDASQSGAAELKAETVSAIARSCLRSPYRYGD